jgi:uncharacterized repeat protein (TIGR01451 family)
MLKQTNIKFKRRMTVAGLAALAITFLAPWATTFAYGPARDTYTNEVPADHVTFNSITNNVAIGDERNFVRIREADSGNKFGDEVKVVPGKEYEVYIYYHNNAASNLNASGKGIANNVRITTNFDSAVNSSKKATITAFINATDATPTRIWDEAYMTTDSTADVVLRYVNASATIHNAGSTNGMKLSTDLFGDDTKGEGHYIGVNKLDGRLPGCAEYSGYITYRLRAEQVGAKVTKTVSLDGVNFFESVTAKPGDTVTYRVEFQNTGTTTLTNVGFHDKLPAGVTLVPGTTKLVNGAHPDGLTMKDIIADGTGFNTGLYTSRANAILTYQVKLNSDIVANGKCGTNSFTNTIFVDHDAGEISDGATITVERTCTGGEEPGDTPEELPKTGPGEVMLAVIAATCVIVGVVYWYRSQKEVEMLQKASTGHAKKSKK